MNKHEWLWYANILGTSANNAQHTLSVYPTPKHLLQADDYIRKVLTPMQYETYLQTNPDMFFNEVEKCKALNIKILTCDDSLYPQELLDIESTPLVLYYRGDVTLLTNSFLFAIIGTRRPSAYGVEATKKIADGLSKNGVVLVSGLATGLDSEAHKAALANNAATVSCLAFGHDICYPAANRTLKNLIEKTGLTISEYPPGTQIQKPFFLARNRIIAAISKGVCVAEARKASGTMNTVTHALEYGKDIFSVPGSIFSPLSDGTNSLISEGANVCTSAEDVLNVYAMQYNEEHSILTTPPLIVSAGAVVLYKYMSPIPKSVEQLCGDTGFKTSECLAYLTELELNGIVRQVSGRRFELIGTIDTEQED